MITIMRDENISVNKFKLVIDEYEGVEPEEVAKLENIAKDVAVSDKPDFKELAAYLVEIRNKAKMFEAILYIPSSYTPEQVYNIFVAIDTDQESISIMEFSSERARKDALTYNAISADKPNADSAGEDKAAISFHKRAISKLRNSVSSIKSKITPEKKEKSVKAVAKEEPSPETPPKKRFLEEFNEKLEMLNYIKRSFG